MQNLTHTFRKSLPLLAACLVVGSLMAQSVPQTGTLPGASQPSVRPFAQPSQISFKHIKDAMDQSTFAIEQVRRTREQIPMGSSKVTEPKTTWVGVKETLLRQGATKNADGQFQLQFVGVEGRKLPALEFKQRAKIFEGDAGFLFQYQSFRVHNVAQAQKNYIIYYLGTTKRVGRPAYRVAILPKAWDRSAWVLELDLETAYPLYRAEYTLDASLRAEVEVTSFKPNVKFSNSLSGWWKPRDGVAAFSNAHKAVAQAIPANASQVVPGAAELPAGYDLAKSHVMTDSLQGTKRAVLVYSDGVDQLFVVQSPKPKSRSNTPQVDDRLYVFENNGISNFYFSRRGVDFQITGGASYQMVSDAAKAVFRQAINTLK